jgi:hypothetical protein
MKLVTLHLTLLALIAAATTVVGCNDSAVESDGDNLCLQQEHFEWYTPCETIDDCCLGSDPLCQVVPDIGEEKVCTSVCTTAPEDDPVENECCLTSQDHNCGSGCCMVNYIEPDGGATNSGYGVGSCAPGSD